MVLASWLKLSQDIRESLFFVTFFAAKKGVDFYILVGGGGGEGGWKNMGGGCFFWLWQGFGDSLQITRFSLLENHQINEVDIVVHVLILIVNVDTVIIKVNKKVCYYEGTLQNVLQL